MKALIALMGLKVPSLPGSSGLRGLIDYGGTTASGGHDHRNNKGPDRTPAQKSGDAKRRRKSDLIDKP